MPDDDEFNLLDFLPYLLNQAAEESSTAFHKVYKDRYGMLRTEWRVLFHLGMYGDLTAKEIALRSRTHKTKISRAVAALEKRRFLTRTRDTRDKRHEILNLTAAGQSAYLDLRSVAQSYHKDLISQFSEQDAKRLRDMLRRLARTD